MKHRNCLFLITIKLNLFFLIIPGLHLLFMFKTILLFCSLIAVAFVYGQTDSLSKEDRRLLDSMFKNDEFIKLMKKEKNYLDVSIGIGNGVFSASNNAANATGVNKQLIYSPAVVYRLKNGLSLAVTGFLTAGSTGNLALYQTGITAGYDYYGKAVNTGLSYTRYLSDQNKYNSKSLYQNDLFAYIKRAKGILQPGISLGFASGKYKETSFISFKRLVHLPNPPPNGRDTLIIIAGKDSTDNKTSYFSLSANIGHDFTFYKIFSKKDALDFIPALLVNFGSDQLTQIHTNKIYNRPALSARKKSDFSNSFQVQSIAASAELTYMVGQFFIDANVYADYYLPATTEKRLSFIFAVTTGFSF